MTRALPLLARMSVLAAAAIALQVPLHEGAGDLTAFLLVSAGVGIGTIASGLRPRGASPAHNGFRLALLAVGLAAIALSSPGAKSLFPDNDPISSPALHALVWMLLVCSGFLFLPDGPLMTLSLSGAVMLVSAAVDYGSVGVVTLFLFLFACVMYELAASGEETGEYGAMFELAAGLTVVTALAAGLVYLLLPALLPRIDVESLTRQLEEEANRQFRNLKLPGQDEKGKPGEVKKSPAFSHDPAQPLDTATGGPPPDLLLFTIRSVVDHHFRLSTFRQFDGRRWSSEAGAPAMAGVLTQQQPLGLYASSKGEVVEQTVRVEGWTGKVLPALYSARSVRGPGGVLGIGLDWSLQLDAAPRQGDTFTIVSHVGMTPPQEPAAEAVAAYLQVPTILSHRVRALAADLARQDPTARGKAEIDVEFLARTCRYRWEFGGPAVEDTVDRFLFDEHIGNCTSFATALAMLLRLQQVPARLVAGFAGGDPDGKGSIRVTARHAHAWVEAWLGNGWATLDAVPPDLDTARQALAEQGRAIPLPPPPPPEPELKAQEGAPKPQSFVQRAPTKKELARGEGRLGAPPSSRSEAWLGTMRARTRAAAARVVETAKLHWVWTLVLVAIPALAALAGMQRLKKLAYLAARLARGDAELLSAEQERDFLEKLKAKGLVREPWETLHEFLERLSLENKAPASLSPLIDLSVRVRYCGRPPGPAERALAKRLLAQLDADLEKL